MRPECSRGKRIHSYAPLNETRSEVGGNLEWQFHQFPLEFHLVQVWAQVVAVALPALLPNPPSVLTLL